MTNKKNTWLFIIAGTIVQVLIILAILLAFVVADAVFIGNENDNGAATLLIAGIIISYLGGSLLYQKLASWVIRKWHLEEKLDPVFVSRTIKEDRFDNGF